jgi:hypothetical protein
MTADPDGMAHFRGHFDEWSLASGADVTLLVTRQGADDGTLTSAPLCGLFGLPGPRQFDDAGSVIALATFRLP